MIAVVNHGVGNVRSVVSALQRLGEDAVLSADPSEVEKADGAILPGVGAFAAAMESLQRTGLDDVLRKLAGAGRPILGICLGLQLFFSESEEHGIHPGLGLLKGGVRRFASALKVPHMGWNEVNQKNASPLFDGITDGSFFYFAHSYYVEPEDTSIVMGVTDYNGDFASAVGSGRVLGVQFHPEKSGPGGLEILANFSRICKEQ